VTIYANLQSLMLPSCYPFAVGGWSSGKWKHLHEAI